MFAQPNVNPNVSAIGTFNIFTNYIKGSDEYGKLNFETPALELFIDGYLNPYSRATVDIAFEEGKFGVEEIYAEVLRGLPLDLQLKAGKYLLGFGKINTVHPHAWSFLDRPLAHQIFFGEEGFNDIGFDVSFILPFESIYTSFDIGVFKGDAIGKIKAADAEDEESILELRGINPITVGRLSMFYDIDDYNNLEVGLNGAYGLHAKSEVNLAGDSTAILSKENLYFLYGGLDFKFKYKPDSYTSFTLQGEGIINNRDVVRDKGLGVNIEKQATEQITTFGGFIYCDYQFLKQFSIGVKYDFTYGIIGDEPGATTLNNDDKNTTSGISGWIGYYPVEETLALRFGVQHLTFNYDDGISRDDETVIKLQILFSLGPHKAHQF
ncbi:MAG: hypothetical protein Q7S39_00925 [Ignavibacteria bacterium]|nr:hypothetical protein [Ignavibacteria bacterium]